MIKSLPIMKYGIKNWVHQKLTSPAFNVTWKVTFEMFTQPRILRHWVVRILKTFPVDCSMVRSLLLGTFGLNLTWIRYSWGPPAVCWRWWLEYWRNVMVKVDTYTLTCGRQVLVSESNRPPVAVKSASENIKESITGFSITMSQWPWSWSNLVAIV